MALFMVSSNAVALTAATAKTAVQLTTPSTADNVWTALDVTFDGATATATPVKVEIISFGSAGTGGAVTPMRIGASQSVASVTTANIPTAEGGTPTIVQSWYIPPTSGMTYQWPLGRELAMVPSKIFGVRCTAPAGVNAIVNVTFEE